MIKGTIIKGTPNRYYEVIDKFVRDESIVYKVKTIPTTKEKKLGDLRLLVRLPQGDEPFRRKVIKIFKYGSREFEFASPMMVNSHWSKNLEDSLPYLNVKEFVLQRHQIDTKLSIMNVLSRVFLGKKRAENILKSAVLKRIYGKKENRKNTEGYSEGRDKELL